MMENEEKNIEDCLHRSVLFEILKEELNTIQIFAPKIKDPRYCLGYVEAIRNITEKIKSKLSTKTT